MTDPTRRLWFAFAIMAGTLCGGTVGYALIERWSLLEAFYMTTITISTVGFGEVHQLSNAGRILTIALIFLGLFAVSFAVSGVVELITAAEIRRIFGRRKLDRQVATLRQHVIVCGFGRMGRMICHELREREVPFVVVDNDPDATAEADRQGYLYLLGEASEEEVLRAAGIERAQSLVAVLDSDADNVFVTLTARGLNERLQIVARAESTESEAKLRRAGANRVVCPHTIGAHRITQILTRPAVVDFIEVATRRERFDFELDEVLVPPTSSLVGKSLRESGIRQKFGMIVVAIKRADGQTLFNPEPDAKIEAHDTLIVIGRQGAARQFQDRYSLQD